MLVVITIIGLIMALVGPRVLNYLSESKVKTARIQIESFSSGARPVLSRQRPLSHLVGRAFGARAAAGQRRVVERSLHQDRDGASGSLGAALHLWAPADHAPYEIDFLRFDGPARRSGSAAPKSRALRNSLAVKRDAGFTLIEVVCVLAIIALLAALALPAISRATSRPRLEAYAMQAASILMADRNAAIRRRATIATALDSSARTMRSGAGAGRVQFPRDVAFDASARADVQWSDRRRHDRLFSQRHVVWRDDRFEPRRCRLSNPRKLAHRRDRSCLARRRRPSEFARIHARRGARGALHRGDDAGGDRRTRKRDVAVGRLRRASSGRGRDRSTAHRRLARTRRTAGRAIEWRDGGARLAPCGRTVPRGFHRSPSGPRPGSPKNSRSPCAAPVARRSRST